MTPIAKTSVSMPPFGVANTMFRSRQMMRETPVVATRARSPRAGVVVCLPSHPTDGYLRGNHYLVLWFDVVALSQRLRSSAIGPKHTRPSALHMSAFGGKADMTLCGNPLLGVKRTSLFAAQISAFDPKRTLRVKASLYLRYVNWRLVTEVLNYSDQRFGTNLHGARKWMIDGDDRQKTAEDEESQCSGHDNLRP
jgi:hypothetical protein